MYLYDSQIKYDYKDIYPDELGLKKENKYLCKASLLDFWIETYETNFIS